jgi:acyl carrier protein
MTQNQLDNPIAERLMAMAARRSGAESLSVDLKTTMNELGIDSLGMAELMFDLDDEFGIEITDEHMLEMKLVSDLVTLIETLVAAKATAA